MTSLLLKRVIRPLHGKVDRTVVLAARNFSRFCSQLESNSGRKGLSDYLESCKLCLRHSLSRSSSPLSPKVRIRTTGCGLPRVIHPIHRKMIRSKDEVVSSHYAALWASIFELNRVLNPPKAAPGIDTIVANYTGN